MLTIAVIIPSFNEENYIGSLLEDLTHQTQKPYEVIVADCQSSDKTITIIKEFKSRLPIKIVHSIDRSAAAARNIGADSATSDYLLFLDADVRLSSDLIQAIKKELTANPVDVLSPRLVSKGKYIADRLILGTHDFATLLRAGVKKVSGITPALCVRISTHRAIGGFDKYRQTEDDLDYVKRLNAQHTSFKYLRKTRVVASDRRFTKDGSLVTFLRSFPERTFFSKHFIQPWLRRTNRAKKYGHYDKVK